jgi:hypothetical protein
MSERIKASIMQSAINIEQLRKAPAQAAIALGYRMSAEGLDDTWPAGSEDALAR